MDKNIAFVISTVFVLCVVWASAIGVVDYLDDGQLNEALVIYAMPILLVVFVGTAGVLGYIIGTCIITLADMLVKVKIKR